jgi:uncharacterized paraquat-inducible protein A
MHDRYVKPIVCATLLCSFVLFILGISCPILFTKTSVFGLTFSAKSVYLTDTIEYFYNERQWLMAFVIFITTLVFPLIKYVDLANRILNVVPIPEKLKSILSHVDKWSMTEVFIVALVILTVKMNSNFMSMEIRSGVTFLTLSIILRMVAVYILSYNYPPESGINRLS